MNKGSLGQYIIYSHRQQLQISKQTNCDNLKNYFARRVSVQLDFDTFKIVYTTFKMEIKSNKRFVQFNATLIK